MKKRKIRESRRVGGRRDGRREEGVE